MKKIIILTILLFGYLGNSQLIDPFGKVVTHEIKLTKLDDGAYMGAMEWTTGGIDSLQRFVVNDLDIKAPVMVRIISKAPDHNIDLSFHKKNWEDVESTISTNGDKFIDKIFRTMGMAGIGVSSKVAGIPYLIIVKVGLQFPSTKSLIRITDDLQEYNRHLRKMGITTIAYEGENAISSKNASSGATNSGNNDNTLMYVIIGLLSLIIVLLGVFLIRKQKSKTTMILWLTMCFSAYSMAQSNTPKSVPIGDPNGDAVFVEYRTSNLANQNSVPVTTIMNVGFEDIDVAVGTSMETRQVRVDTAPGVRELTGEEAREILRRIKEANEEFDRQYRENMPGEPTDGDQRTLPIDRTQQELEQLRRQVRQLQRRVDILERGDEEYEEQDNDGEEIVIYCEQIEECQMCIEKGYRKFMKHHAYYEYLQNFYRTKMNQLSGWISYGDALASTPGAGLGWGPIRQHKVIPSMEGLVNAYNQKFDEYMQTMEYDLNEIEVCYGNDQIGHDAIPNQVFAMIEQLKNTRILDYQL